MGAFHISLLCLFLSFTYLLLKKINNSSRRSSADGSVVLPPGKTGWPLIGETLEFMSKGWNGKPEKFVMDRMAKFSPDVFRTHLLGEPSAVFCGPAGNKFLFSNENKLVRVWIPRSIDKIVGYSETTSAEESFHLRKMVADFLTPKGLQGYIGIMDQIAQSHFAVKWEKQQQLEVLPLTRQYASDLASRLFLSIDEHNPNGIALFSQPFDDLLSGMLSVPINLPGTPMNKAIKASKLIREQIVSIIRQRKIDLAQGKASPRQDILSGILSSFHHDDEKFMSEPSIAGRILGLLIAGHDTSSVACAFVVRHLGEHPDIYEAVRNEQIEITKSKAPGELLNWEDLQKMKYSWNVVCEVLRISSPAQGTFREAIADFTYKGFSIPKGWKLYWSVNSTHKNPEFFPEPEKFDPSRFEGTGPAPYTFVPFGGGPRMCPGKEYARLEILVFIHHLVKRFKWENMIPNEHIVVNLVATPAQGLPIRLFSHKD